MLAHPDVTDIVDDAPSMRILAIEAVHPSPQNPRTHLDETALQELAESIRQHGILEPIVVRPGKGPLPNWTIIAGERRWRAARLAGLRTIPAIIRTVRDDAHATTLAIVENLQRSNLSPLDEAAGYQRLAGAGWTQARIARAVAKSQPYIANALRLLKLPDDVQAMLRDGRLTAAHGRALARYAGFPHVLSRLAQWTTTHHASSRQLEARHLPNGAELVAAGLAVSPAHWREPFKTQCPACPLHAFLGGYCLRPDHHAQLEAEAQALTRQQTEARPVQNQRPASETPVGAYSDTPAQPSETPVGAYGDTPEQPLASQSPPFPRILSALAPEASREAHAAQTASGDDAVPSLSSLQPGLYVQLWDRSPTPCLAGDCPCRREATGHQGEPVSICIDTIRHRRLDLERQREHEESQRRALLDVTHRIQRWIDDLPDSLEAVAAGSPTARSLVIVATAALSQTYHHILHRAISRHAGAHAGTLRAAALAGRTGRATAFHHAALLPPSQLLKLTLESLLLNEAEGATRWDATPTPWIDWLLDNRLPPSPTRPLAHSNPPPTAPPSLP